MKNLLVILIMTFGLPLVSANEDRDAYFRRVERLALRGNDEAQYAMGYMYQKGEALFGLKDVKEAEKWYRRAALQGNVNAQFALGLIHGNGAFPWVKKDAKESVKWYRKAAEQGYAEAQHNLGMIYDDGEGVLEDDKEAVKWYRKAAEQGLAQAHFSLGVMHWSGDGLPMDYKKAEKLFHKAAEQGFAGAQYALGLIYSEVEKDYVTAYAWMNLAAANGEKNAARAKTNIAKLMTRKQITKAQELSKEMIKKNRKLLE